MRGPDTQLEERDKQSMPFIALRGVSKVYDQLKQPVVALQETDLEIRQREFVSIMGPSGSGKSTLLHILGALDRPSTGTYLLEGVDITALKDKELARVRRDHFGFVFQSYNLFPELTAVENVEVPMIYAGVPARQRRARAKELLERLGLGHRLAHRPLELSGGEQQRVAIAKAIAHRPKLLLADEPTAELDSQMAAQIMKVFRAIIETEQVTICMTTHDPTILEVADHVYEMVDGKFI